MKRARMCGAGGPRRRRDARRRLRQRRRGARASASSSSAAASAGKKIQDRLRPRPDRQPVLLDGRLRREVGRGRQNNVDFSVQGAPEFDVAKQTAIVNAVIGQKPDAIMISHTIRRR